jgi:hypothetical protein
MSLAFRLTIWYAASFIIIGCALSLISYFYLASAVRDNRKLIQSKLNEVASTVQSDGVDAVDRLVTEKISRPWPKDSFHSPAR